MNDRAATADAENSISPLAGEPGIPNLAERVKAHFSRKGLLTVALMMTMVVVVVVVIGVTIRQFTASGKGPDDGASKQVSDRPTAASAEPRRLEMPTSPAASTEPAGGPRIPALVPTAEEAAEPIGVRRTGQPGSTTDGAKPVSAEDAPMLLVSSQPGTSNNRPVGSAEPDDPVAASNRNLQDYERQLQGLLESLTKPTTPSTSSVTGPGFGDNAQARGAPSPAGLFGGQLQSSATPRVSASMLGDRSLTLPKGTAFTCALKTKVISAVSGFVGCQVQRHVYSDDGKVLLIERGSHMDGEYRITSVRPGIVRIPVLWTRIRTPHGVTVDIESPGTGPLGESGIDGYVDNRWGERIGAAMLLSLINDSVKLVIQSQMNSTSNGSNTVLLPSTTDNSSKLAEKVLDSTINIPPLIYQNQGGIVGIYVARDVDFSSVYSLKAVQR